MYVTPDFISLQIAKQSIQHGYAHSAAWIPAPDQFPLLHVPSLVYTTITHMNKVIGCQGHKLGPTYVGVSMSAYKSAFQDLRDGHIHPIRIQESEISVSWLIETAQFTGTSLKLLPHVSKITSVKVQWGGCQALMLSQVQTDTVNTQDFLCKLLHKAHIKHDHELLTWTLYHTHHIGPKAWNQIPNL